MISTHLKKYAHQIGSFPQVGMNINKKYLRCQQLDTLQRTNISHPLGKGGSSSKCHFWGTCCSLEGTSSTTEMGRPFWKIFVCVLAHLVSVRAPQKSSWGLQTGRSYETCREPRKIYREIPCFPCFHESSWFFIYLSG